MAHFAKVENGIVTNVVVIDNAHEANGEAYLNSIGLEGTWIQTSYNGNIRNTFAAVGCQYDSDKDVFLPIKPFRAWVFSDSLNDWVAPILKPTDGKSYGWDDDLDAWTELLE